jgi:hypothetical protein
MNVEGAIGHHLDADARLLEVSLHERGFDGALKLARRKACGGKFADQRQGHLARTTNEKLTGKVGFAKGDDPQFVARAEAVVGSDVGGLGGLVGEGGLNHPGSKAKD